MPNLWTISQTEETNADAGRLGDPAGNLFLEACPALPCFALATLVKSCFCSGWCWHLFPPEQGSSLPTEGNLSHMRVPTHLERLGVMPGDVPRLTPSRRTCPLVLHHSWLVKGPWSCWGRRRALSVGSKARPGWVKACTSSLGRPQRYSEWGCPEKLRGEPHHEWHEVAGTDRTDRGKQRSR